MKNIKTFLEHINESSSINPLKEELNKFLKRENIIGFDKEILSILEGNPTEDVVSDIIESFENEDNIRLSKDDVLSMDLKGMLERFLSWHNLDDYTESIINITGKTKRELYDNRDLLVWRDKYYYYRPKHGDNKIWTWDNPKTTGTPKLIKVEDIYNTPTYYSKDYYKDVEKPYISDN